MRLALAVLIACATDVHSALPMVGRLRLEDLSDVITTASDYDVEGFGKVCIRPLIAGGNPRKPPVEGVCGVDSEK